MASALPIIIYAVIRHCTEHYYRLSKYFRGQHHLEGIMLMENVPRSQLLTLIDKFSEVLVTCTLPEQLAA